MQNGVFQFADPSKFSDWATYAGFDRRTGDVGIAPTNSPNLEDLQNRVSDTASQIGQGNILQAAKTFAGVKPPTTNSLTPLPPLGATPKPPQSPYSGLFNYDEE